MKQHKLIITLSSLYFFFCHIINVHSAPVNFSKKALHKHIRILSSDKFKGRAPIGPGEHLTVDYLIRQYKKIGLLPGYNGSFIQSVPLLHITKTQDPVLSIGGKKLQYAKDFVATNEKSEGITSLKNIPFVFAGYGIESNENDHHDYAKIDVKNKIVLVLVNDPGHELKDPQIFEGNRMTYFGRWTYKIEEAQRQGARGIIIIHETGPAGYPWAILANGDKADQFSLESTNNGLSENKLDLTGWIQHTTLDQLIRPLGLNYKKLKEMAIKGQNHTIKLPLDINFELKKHFAKVVSKNVIGVIPGQDKILKDEYLIYSAHWDHLGISGKNIYHGAIDNASGVAALLELAKGWKESGVTPKRSILFVSFTAEEQGLLGSNYFSQHPPNEMKKAISILNMDGMNVKQATKEVINFSQNMSDLDDYLNKWATHQGRKVIPDPVAASGLFFRSDHFSLAKHGVPGLVFINIGTHDPDYVKLHYHRPSDSYDSNWGLSGLVQDMELLYFIGWDVAQADKIPAWKRKPSFLIPNNIIP